MEKFLCKQDCKLGYFKDEVKKGQEFPVLRNIRNECVLKEQNTIFPTSSPLLLN